MNNVSINIDNVKLMNKFSSTSICHKTKLNMKSISPKAQIKYINSANYTKSYRQLS